MDISVPASSHPSQPATARYAVTTGERLFALLVALACGAVLGLAAWLPPSSEGFGTHTKLGLPPCAWPKVVGGPCPTCGMTTAFSYAAHGRFLPAFLAQPFGFMLAVVAAAGFWASLHIAATGSHAGRIYVKLLRPRVLWTLAGLALIAWAYKWITWPTG